MLKDAISKIRGALKEARQTYSVEEVAAVEQVFADVKNLNLFISREIEIIEGDKYLTAGPKKMKDARSSSRPPGISNY